MHWLANAGLSGDLCRKKEDAKTIQATFIQKDAPGHTRIPGISAVWEREVRITGHIWSLAIKSRA